jgi:hypothetical protein
VLPLLLVLALSVLLALIPVALVQRYRVGTARQRARGWLATINLIGLSLSVVLFLATATVTTMWVPGTLTYTAAGLATGALLGVFGLRLTRWETSAESLHYTPNRLLVLGIMLLVTGRLLYGFWRGWQSWRLGLSGESWYVAAGVAGSMAAGAAVLGYYLVYWIGVRRRHSRHAAQRLRPVPATGRRRGRTQEL